jgi:hypothetical protein
MKLIPSLLVGIEFFKQNTKKVVVALVCKSAGEKEQWLRDIRNMQQTYLQKAPKIETEQKRPESGSLSPFWDFNGVLNG